MDAILVRAQAYVGVPYLDGEFDCADLAAKVQWEMFGRLIRLPTHRRRPVGAMGQAREIRAFREDLADRIDAAVTGCGVLMYEPGDRGQIWHIGTAFVDVDVVWVLHNSHKLGSAHLHRLTDLIRFGLRLEGFYAWRG